MAFRQHRHARHAAVRREVMQMDVQQRRARHFHATLQRLLNVLEIIKPLGAKQIYDQMGARISNAIAFDEVVLPVFVCATSAR